VERGIEKWVFSSEHKICNKDLLIYCTAFCGIFASMSTKVRYDNLTNETNTAHFVSIEIHSGIARFPCISTARLYCYVLP